MTNHYKVWLEIEEVDESRDHYQSMDAPFASVATFTSYREARKFVDEAHLRLADHAVEQPPAQSSSGFFQTPMQLLLIHGRRDPDAEMSGWGFDAEPICGIAFLHVAYFSTLTVGFVSEEAYAIARLQTGWRPFDDLILEIDRSDGLIKLRDGYFGDFELAMDNSLAVPQAPSIVSR